MEALLTQRQVAQTIGDAGGNSVMIVQEHQPPRKAAIALVYGVTSLSPERATPGRVLELVRGHGAIEHTSHWVRDVTFDADRSQVRCGNIPHVMAALRTTAIGLLRWAGHPNIAAACRRLAAQPAQALALIGIAFEN